ncbi:MAG: glycerophosphodiester phosphodiesterase [Candidatus Hodarchaeales archaeon]|jgi:glycerophosphoryl diester phosphodiesterase
MIKIIAHRGYRKNGEPENSIPAFQTAINYGADGIEFDIHSTADQKLVCFHEETLENIGRPDAIKDLTCKEIHSIELADGIFIPTLEEILENFGNKVFLNIDFKSGKRGINELIRLIHLFDLKKSPENFIVSSFIHSPLNEIKKIDPDIQTGLLCYFSKNQLRKAQELKCNALHPFYDVIPKDWVKFNSFRISSALHKYFVHKDIRNAQKQGLMVNLWVVNHKFYLRSAFQRDITSVITDEVELAKQIKNEIA